MQPRPFLDPRPDDEITQQRSREAMRRDQPTHGDKPAEGRMALGEAIKRMGW